MYRAVFALTAITIIAASSKLLNYCQTKKGLLKSSKEMKWKSMYKISKN